MSVRNILIVGGGVGGLTAAHYLAGCGHHVTVVEQRKRASGEPELGGKAYSFRTSDGRPAEHGFRFFPGFYWHVIDTMREIPVGQHQTVADRLVGLTQAQIAADADPAGLTGQMTIPVPSSRHGATLAIPTLNVTSIEPGRVAALMVRMFTLPFPEVVTDQNPNVNGDVPRRSDDDSDWWNFSGAADQKASKAFQAFFGVGLSRCFVATRAEEMSARTGAEILMLLMFDFTGRGPETDADRAFDRPTSEAWFDDWHRELKRRGVKFVVNEVTGVHFDTAAQRVDRLNTRTGSLPKFDDVVLAVPVDDARKILATSADLIKADPELRRLVNTPVAQRTLVCGAMNGIVFYPDKVMKHLIEGHYLVVESPWALTAVYQSNDWWTAASPAGQFSVIISDWDSASPVAAAAKTLPDVAVANETWRQLQAAIPSLRTVARPARYLIDPARSTWVNGERANDMPMLINRSRSWRERPHAGLTPGKVKNLVLAGDYVRATTDFASMEAANETGRRAARVLIQRHGSPNGQALAKALPEVRDRLPVPKDVELMRGMSKQVRRIGRLLGDLLNPNGTLSSVYEADSFANLVIQAGGIDAPDPSGFFGQSNYDDSWLPAVVRLGSDELFQPIQIYEAMERWAESLNQVSNDLTERGLLEPLRVVDTVKDMLMTVDSLVKTLT